MDITNLKKAYAALERTIKSEAIIGEDLREIYRMAAIKNFELCFELSWKAMQRWLLKEEKSLEMKIRSKKDLFRDVYGYGLVTDSNKWIEFLDMRNDTSHSYDDITAEEVFVSIKEFYEEITYFIEKLEEILDDSFR